jgi:hypothetical protein
MLHVARRTLTLLALTVAMLAPASPEAKQQPSPEIHTANRPALQRRIPDEARSGGALPFVRTELFFGTARPDEAVTEEQFMEFVDAEVTPRFPDGLTVLKGDGQFRSADGVLIKEQSFVLVLLYPYQTLEKSSQRIQRIRALYESHYDQESVLRVDDPFVVWASF